jgi:hypothetical protein
MKLFSFQDLYDNLHRLGYRGSTLENVRGAVARCAQPTLYNAPLGAIPVDLDAFDRRWHAPGLNPVAMGFRGQSPTRSFKKWRSYLRGALERALGHRGIVRDGEDADDGWRPIRLFIAANSGFDMPFRSNQQLTISRVAKRARIDGREPRDLDDVWVAAQYDALSYGARKAFLRGVRTLNRLVESRDEYPDIAPLLPLSPLAEPVRRRRHVFAGGAVLPPSFDADLQAFLAWYQFEGRDRELAQAYGERGKPEASKDAYSVAISWLVRELVEGGVVDPSIVVDLRTICTPDLIRQAAVCFSRRRNAAGTRLKKETTSLHSYVSKVAYVARCWCRIDLEARARLKKLVQDPSVGGKRVGKISAEREAWIRTLDTNTAMQRIVLTLPERFQKASRDRLARWAELRASERMEALRLGIAAAQAAIMLRALPARASNIRELRFRGEDATLFRPTKDRKGGWIDIPGEEVKNHTPLDADLDDAWPVVEWYFAEIRPRLLDDHPYNKNAEDSAFVFPGMPRVDEDGRRKPARAMDGSTFAQAFAVAVEMTGISMTHHQARHAVVYVILKADPNAIGVAAAWLGDDETTVAKFYSFLNVKRAGTSARGMIKKATNEARSRRGRGR